MSKKKSSVEKRKHIRYSAYLCFREKGYHQTSIDDVCTTANISKGSFYWHYGAKLDVFIDILETWAREVIDELLEQFEMATRSPDRIALLSKAFEKEFHRARAIVPLWAEFSLLGRKDKEIQLSIGKFFRRARAAISEILRQTTRETLSEEEIKAASSIILGAYMGLVLQEFADPNADAAIWAQNFMGMLQILLHNPKSFTSISHKIGDRLTAQRITTIVPTTQRKKKIFLRIRDIILETNPNINERWIQGWKVVGYYHKGLVCHLKHTEKHIELAFHQGATLNDPNGLLIGENKKRRYLYFDSLRTPKGFTKLLSEAFSQSTQSK